MVNVTGRATPRAASTGDLLQILRDRVPRTKAEIAALTGLSRSTVATRVDALLALGLVAPAGEAASSGGRPPSRIAFAPASRVVIGIDIGATHGVVAIADLAGSILAERSAQLRIADGPETVLDWATTEALSLLTHTGHRETDLLGIGVGLPGPVEHSTGLPVNPPIMPGWDRFDVPAHIRRSIPVDVLVDNDVNILALGEHAMSWPDSDELIFVKVSTGVGAGIIMGGELQRGARGSAGDLGHVRLPVSDSASSPDLEEIAGGPAIAARIGGSTSADVVAAVRAGRPEAFEAVRQAGRDVGEVLSGVVNLLNPSVVVVGGSIARAGEHLIAGVREVVYRRSIPLATQDLSIVTSRGGESAGALGAAIMVINSALAPENVDALLRASNPVPNQGP
ncbi:ROK family transcriptional regulator [Paramicrobacterium agarici]|uniref:ROK family transcriptional regulator n=1 Tax=Paramicrobacterium agarici TaxID=630514 RepID=UPI00114D85DF|nr:ROK family transcriptional regulator [Microbacterium agarici]TQO22137.1 glucokinase [Microbacterium agarici]